MHWTCRRRVRFAHAQTLAYICKLVAGTFSRQVPRFTRSWQLENEVRCLSGLHGQGKDGERSTRSSSPRRLLGLG